MNPGFVPALLAAFLISLGSLVGIFTLAVNKEKLSRVLLFLVALSAGTLMGGAFLHLLPEAVENLSPQILFSTVLVSFILFFLIEKIFHWRHCHKGECDTHTFGSMNLVGDAIHNFIDGLIIAAAFASGTGLGIATSLAVALHEIPQEIGDFGVLLHAGFNRKKALLANFAVASTSLLGVLIGFYISDHVDNLIVYLIPFAAGGFIYIAASDLMPEIRKETNLKKSLVSFGTFILGVSIMYFTSLLE